ncbi:unnamed protein product [Pleuronectes platessa]|uniref:Uncharacterized protein n=1 Tax=Pleuronectes platessa TaxID=8262 RepID=A0A9N7TID7_PLEPL|nr:unnamed protein product [Pleuronectes platessa]
MDNSDEPEDLLDGKIVFQKNKDRTFSKTKVFESCKALKGKKEEEVARDTERLLKLIMDGLPKDLVPNITLVQMAKSVHKQLMKLKKHAGEPATPFRCSLFSAICGGIAVGSPIMGELTTWSTARRFQFIGRDGNHGPGSCRHHGQEQGTTEVVHMWKQNNGGRYAFCMLGVPRAGTLTSPYTCEHCARFSMKTRRRRLARQASLSEVDPVIGVTSPSTQDSAEDTQGNTFPAGASWGDQFDAFGFENSSTDNIPKVCK